MFAQRELALSNVHDALFWRASEFRRYEFVFAFAVRVVLLSEIAQNGVDFFERGLRDCDGNGARSQSFRRLSRVCLFVWRKHFRHDRARSVWGVLVGDFVVQRHQNGRNFRFDITFIQAIVLPVQKNENLIVKRLQKIS